MKLQILFFVVLGVILFVGVMVLMAVVTTAVQSSGNSEVRRLKRMIPALQKKKQEKSYWIRLFMFYDRVPGLGTLQKNYRKRIISLHTDNERVVRTKVSKDLTLIILLFTLMISVGWLGARSVESFFLITCTAVYACVMAFDFFISRTEKRVLNELEHSIGKVNDAYQSSKMVVEAVVTAAENSGPLTAGHLKKVSEVLADDSDIAVERYYRIAPNDYLKKLTAQGRNVLKHGDAEEVGPSGKPISNFIDGVSKILEELRLDILKREKLDARTAGYRFMAILPVFFVDPLKLWVENSLDMVQGFFDSSMGLFATIAVYIAIIVSFVGSAVVRNVSTDNRNTTKEGRVFAWIMKKSFFVRKMLERIAPMHKETLQSKKVMNRYEPTLLKANSTLTVQQLVLKKIIYSTVGFVVGIALMIAYHQVNLEKLLDLTATQASEATQTEYIQKQKRVAEAEFVEKYRNENLSEEELRQIVAGDINFNRYAAMDKDAEDYTKNLISRLNSVRNEKFMWYDIWLAVTVAFGFWFLPNILLLFRASLRKKDMQLEVDGFFSDIITLSKNERMMVYEVIESMHRYSSVFRPQLRRCLVSYDKGATDALKTLAKESGSPDMERIAGRLIDAENKVTMREAFRDLEGQRVLSLGKRELEYEKLIENRGAMAAFFGNTPLLVLVTAYLLVPFGLSLISTFMDSWPSIKEILGGL